MTGKMVIRYPRPPMNLVWQSTSPNAPGIFVGGMHAAADIGYLKENGVGTVLNCSVNADIDFVTTPYETESSEALNNFGYSPIRYYKLGLVDGPGNPPEMLMAGYYLLCGIASQSMPEKSSYPNQERGHILVNCRAGRSRSIVLVSMYLHLQKTAKFPTFDDALLFVRKSREIRPAEFHDAPNDHMISTAKQAIARCIQSGRSETGSAI